LFALNSNYFSYVSITIARFYYFDDHCVLSIRLGIGNKDFEKGLHSFHLDSHTLCLFGHFFPFFHIPMINLCNEFWQLSNHFAHMQGNFGARFLGMWFLGGGTWAPKTLAELKCTIQPKN